MIKRTIAGSLSRVERETHISCVYADDGSFEWFAETSIPTHITKLTAAGWERTEELYSDSGAIQEVCFKTKTKAPITFRDVTKPKRTLSEEERQAAAERLAKARQVKGV